jgi:hypothetical protein
MLYEDILEALKIKETNKYNEIVKNKNYKKITTLVEQLIKTIYTEEKIVLINDIKSLESIRITKNKIIEKIKQEIENINNVHHLHIDKIIKNGNINKKELEFALKIIYQEPKTQEEIEKSKEYGKAHSELTYINNILELIKENNGEILNKLKKIKELNLQNKEPKRINIFKHIKWKKENKKIEKEKETKKQEIIKLLENTIKHTHDNVKDKCIKEIYEIEEIIKEIQNKSIDNETRHNIKFKINKINNELETKIKELLEEKKENQKDLRTNIKLTQEQINEILYIENKSYAYTITTQTFQNQKNKKDELIFKVILMIKLISMIENNEINIQNIIEEEKEKTK